MQRRIDDPPPPGQRRVMSGDQFSRVIAPGGPQRFETTENQIAGNLPMPFAYGQMGQAPQHLQPAQAVHPPVAAAALSAVHQGGVAPAPTVHQPPTHQAGAPQQVAQMAQGGLAAPQAGQQQQQQFQRLKVEDALSYLDQVKLQFGSQPSVYNDFLDIMKEFKSQTIDTPGVINRVSNLFKGHPELIVGFNTFLPPGYKIEVDKDVINVYQPGQASVPIAALNVNTAAATTPTGSSLVLQDIFYVYQSQQPQPPSQKSPAHLPAVVPPPSQPPQPPSQPLPPPVIHSYPAPRPAHPDVALPIVAHAAQPASAVATASPQAGNQPVEFNHAINYVNKIKNRFQGQPEVYKQFLEILHTYQKEQRTIKEGMIGASNKPLTETEVYSQVARLFHNQEDLLAEFGQFLPDANGGGSSYFFPDSGEGRRSTSDMSLGVRNDHSTTVKKPGFTGKTQPSKTGSQLKRPPCGSGSGLQPPSKMRKADSSSPQDSHHGQGVKYKTGMLKDVSMAEAGKYASLKEYAFFDQVRNALRSNEVYNNFLRCLILFNLEVISRSELISMVHPFLGKHPELYKWFKEFLGHRDSGNIAEPMPHGAAKERSVRDEYNMEIDYQSCKRYGASYRALPSTYPQPKCSGRTQLCREVLNDTWVSIPTWSEDSTFVTSRKSQFEEYIYKCEDERFELDVVVEMNFATIKTLEHVQRKMQRMSTEEAAKFRLDNTLGGSSEFVARKAICRIYGEKSTDIIDGLKKNPVVAVPLVLRRLRAKDEEWRDAQKGFNKVWREQNEKYYLKSLDHQGMTFKQNDIKALRGKSLINEIETILEEQTEAQQQQGQGQREELEPQIREMYEDKSVFEDAASIIIHNMKRQTSIHPEDKKKIKQLVYHLVRDFLFYPRGELSDDEDDNDTDGDGDRKPKLVLPPPPPLATDSVRSGVKPEQDWPEDQVNGLDAMATSDKGGADSSQEGNLDSAEMDLSDEDVDEQYTLFYGNTHWYLFFRMHYKLCGRLLHFRNMSEKIALQEESSKTDRRSSTALALRLRTPFDVEPAQYYTYFLECIKNLMDCSIESSQYEDTLREMYGINSYMAFTMDKHVQTIVRGLHHLVMDEVSMEMVDYFLQERASGTGSTGGLESSRQQRSAAELLYQRRAEAAVAEDNCFKFVFYKKSGAVHITLLDQGSDQGEEVADTERWAQYVERYVNMTPTDCSPHTHDRMVKLLQAKPIFLSRNVASWRRENLSSANTATSSTDNDQQPQQQREEEEDEEMEEEGGSEEEKRDEDYLGRRIHGNKGGDSKPESAMFHAMECLKDVNDGRTMVADGAGVRFTLNSLKIQHICWGAEMWYRRSALYDARRTHGQVSLAKHHKFLHWLERWHSDKGTTETEHQECEDFLMGRGDGVQPSTSTSLAQIDLPGKAPYYPYNRYRVKRRAPTPTTIPSTSAIPATASIAAPTPVISAPLTQPMPAVAVATAIPDELFPSLQTSRPSSRPSTPAE